ncbi:MAG: DRTGG domain-containing protein [Caldisericia bacterium]|jgi:predicted transcriptional regulator|nr:DRTGG domain-containing protein [Caldisericia bacterium]
MDIKFLIQQLSLKVYSEGKKESFTSGFTCDLLSVVLANSPKDSIWITVQRHVNIIAVATLREISGIIISQGFEPGEDVIKKAKEEGIYLLGSNLDSFTLSGEIYKLLKNG